MDNLNLDDNEAVMHTTQRLIINGVSYEGVFTGSRLILVNTDSRIPKEIIPFASIALAVADTNKLYEPYIRLTIPLPEGGTQDIILIYIHLDAGRNVQNRDKGMAILKDHDVPVRIAPNQPPFPTRSIHEELDPVIPVGGLTSGRPAAPEWTVYGMLGGTAMPLPEEPKPPSPLVTILSIMLIIALLIGAMIVPIPGPEDKAASSGHAGGKSGITPTPSPAPGPATTPVPVATATPEVPLPPGSVPGKGIYAKIICPGNYTGFLSAGGWRMDVNSSGTHVYQLPVQDTMITVFIEKLEGSSDPLEVGIYNGGVPVERQETTKPGGIVEMHVSVGPAITGAALPATAAPTLTSTPAIPEPTAFPVQYSLPATGVWVHVAYPGNYTGTISPNGQRQDINASGDRMYQMVMKNGTIDAVLEKADGSANALAVEVYKDGTLIDLANTTIPLGSVEIHTRI